VFACPPVSFISDVKAGYATSVRFVPWTKANKLFIPPPVGERRIVCLSVCVCVCVSACNHIFGTTRPNFLCMLPMAAAPFFSGGVVIRYVFPVLWITSYLHISWSCSKSPPGWGSEVRKQLLAGSVRIPVTGSGRSGLLLAVRSTRPHGSSPGGSTGGGVCGLSMTALLIFVTFCLHLAWFCWLT